MSDQQVRQLLDQGLTSYGLGKLDEAIAFWKQVLDIDPDNTRAREYLDFVQSNWGPRGSGPGGAATDPEQNGDVPPLAPAAGDSAFSRPPQETQAAAAPQSGYQRPVAVAGWGNLFDLDAGEPPGTATASPTPAAPPAVAAAPAAGPSAETAGTQSSEAPARATPEAQPQPNGAEAISSTLPPHPPSPADTPAEKTSSQQDPTRLYESVPTVVRPATEQPPAPAVGGDSAPPGAGTAVPAASPSAPAPREATAAATAAPPSASGPAPTTTGGDALDLVAGADASTPVAAPAQSPTGGDERETLLQGIRDLMELDDFSGAIELIDKLLALDPDHQAARRLRTEAEQQLQAMYSSKIGKLDGVPRVRIGQDELIWLNLDHRAGFVLSLVDGRTSFDEIISVCGLPLLDALRILAQLLQENVIEVS